MYATDLPHSLFEPLHPKVFRGTLKGDLVSFRRRPVPSKVSISEKLSIIFSVFRFFFGQNWIFRSNGQLLPKVCRAYSESHWSGVSFELLGDIFWASHKAQPFFQTQWDVYVNSILHGILHYQKSCSYCTFTSRLGCWWDFCLSVTLSLLLTWGHFENRQGQSDCIAAGNKVCWRDWKAGGSWWWW